MKELGRPSEGRYETYRSRLLRRYLQTRLQKEGSDARRRARRAIKSDWTGSHASGRALFEKTLVYRAARLAAEDVITTAGPDVLSSSLDLASILPQVQSEFSGRPALAFTAHIGAPLVLPASLLFLGIPQRWSAGAWYADTIRSWGAPWGYDPPIVPRPSLMAGVRLLRAVRAGEIVLISMDMLREAGTWAKFPEISADFEEVATALGAQAQRTVFVAVRFANVFRPSFVMDVIDVDLGDLGRSRHAVESYIRANAAQWYWEDRGYSVK